jgi:hypothetical protein
VLHKCANPSCHQPFRRLSQGKLFQVERAYPDSLAVDRPRGGRLSRPPRQVEHFWLCDDCCLILTLTFESGRGMVVVPLPEAARKKSPRPMHYLEPAPTFETGRASGDCVEQ